MAYKNRKANYPLYETTKFDNLRTMVENVAARYPDRYAFTFRRHPNDETAQHMTYAECEAFVRDVATELLAKGAAGKTVAIVGEASPEWLLSYTATMTVGGITVPVDKELPPLDMASILGTAECEFAFVTKQSYKKIAETRDELPMLKTVVFMDDDPAEGCVGISELRAAGAERVKNGDRGYFDYPINNEGLASIVFTSGTTGKGKGVMLSQKNICSDMEQGMYNFDITLRTMLVLPPHHTFGSTVNFVGHFAQGCEIYISSGIRYIMKELKEFQPTHLILVPLFVETFYKRIMSSAEKQGSLKALTRTLKLSNGMLKVGVDMRKQLFKPILKNFGGKLEMIICGGAALNQDVIDFFEGIGITVLNGYGITECAPLISCNRNEYRKKGSVGLPILGGRVKIVDPDENGEGEIAFKGPNVMLGYFRNEEATKQAIDEDGYFHTGDYGKIIVEGLDQWIYITGRLKNLIIFSNGKNVYPEEIETDIQGVYGVGEVVVYAGESLSDPKKEVIVAEIYPDFDSLKMHKIDDPQAYFEEEIRKINQKNVSYKAVGKVKIRNEEFPKNTSKKIIRFAIDKSID